MNIEKAKFGRFIIKDCTNCKTVFDYQVTNIQIDNINNYLCDDCLNKLIIKASKYLDDKENS